MTARLPEIPSDNATISFVNRYGGDCRDCADEDGVCPVKGLPCEPKLSATAIRHVIAALNWKREWDAKCAALAKEAAHD